MDFGLFDDRFTVGLSYYDKKTEDCFTTVNVSTVNGVNSYVMNGGSLTNQGYSVYITGYPVRTEIGLEFIRKLVREYQ